MTSQLQCRVTMAQMNTYRVLDISASTLLTVKYHLVGAYGTSVEVFQHQYRFIIIILVYGHGLARHFC